MKNNVWQFRFEEKTLRAMIAIYCRRSHGQTPALCAECEALERYALQRLENCVFGPQKPVCADCLIHCYEPAMREKVRAIMRFAGPLMLKYHPLLALAHLIRRRRRREPKLRRTGT